MVLEDIKYCEEKARELAKRFREKEALKYARSCRYNVPVPANGSYTFHNDDKCGLYG